MFSVAMCYTETERFPLREILIYDICHLLFQILGANFIYYVLVLTLFDQRKYSLFSFALFISLYSLAVVNRIFVIYIVEPFFVNLPHEDIINVFTDLRYLIIHYVFPILSGSFIFVSLLFMLRYKNEKQNSVQLSKEKVEMELKILRAQLNPHFLFNTLNNIYSLSISNSSKTSESIERLSNILDYVLYIGQKKTVLVSDELRIIDDYIELEKLRYDTRLEVHISAKLTHSNYVPPLLYLSLVENAFKHGAEKTSGKVKIIISLETTSSKSIFKIRNSFRLQQAITGNGMGLPNIEQQLRLYYQGEYNLRILRDNIYFTVEMETPSTNDSLYYSR